MSITPTNGYDQAFEERWRQWQLRGAIDSRRAEIRARIVFALAVSAALAWFGFQLL